MISLLKIIKQPTKTHRNCYGRILNHLNGDTQKANDVVNQLYHDIDLQSDGKLTFGCLCVCV